MDINATAVVTDGAIREWQKDLPELGDLEVLVAPWENAAFERAMQKGIRALPPALRPDGVIEPAAFARVQGRAMSTTIIFGWRNFKDAGAEVAFDAKVAEQYLVNPKFKVLRDGFIIAARRVQTGIKTDEEAVLGNSQKSSLGSETGEAMFFG